MKNETPTRAKNIGTMTLDYEIDGKETCVFRIYDVSGREVKLLILTPENKTVNIDATELNAGAYYYNIKVNNLNVKTDKLIIVK